ncbi:hypothetical protein BCR43DRAFT_499507 [Syncephalastrum racemosum]|uniref:RING-type domain-containing protein n=1 Tax=Syncephalastrum racemosum TaxID=13706 RepID=A0A1X2H0F9_SYNRA|nr:hypothetical protein BCR43DRAFT_499507 [Syncephalastrum racemosum]
MALFPSYLLASVVSFSTALVVSLRSFGPEWALRECRPSELNLRPSTTTAQLDPACSFLNAFFTHVESQRLSLLIHLNMVLCTFLLLGKAIVRLVFRELLPSESQHVYDRMLNFLLFKMIFVGAVMDPAWIRLSIWIAILGFLRIFSLLSRDRFDHLTTLPHFPLYQYKKISLLLCSLFTCDLLWYLGSFHLFPSSITFLTLEFLPVALDTLQVMTKYGAQLIDQWREQGFENKRMVNYYAELGTDMLVLAITLLQYLQLMWMHGISFSLIDIVLILNVRSVMRSLYKKAIVHRDRWRAMTYVKTKYVDASPGELLKHNDDCAICREKMKSAKKLSCGHLFHLHCLHSWIQHHVSQPTCPTCRRPLSDDVKYPS